MGLDTRRAIALARSIQNNVRIIDGETLCGQNDAIDEAIEDVQELCDALVEFLSSSECTFRAIDDDEAEDKDEDEEEEEEDDGDEDDDWDVDCKCSICRRQESKWKSSHPRW